MPKSPTATGASRGRERGPEAERVPVAQPEGRAKVTVRWLERMVIDGLLVGVAGLQLWPRRPPDGDAAGSALDSSSSAREAARRKTQSSRWQQLAAVPEEQFEAP